MIEDNESVTAATELLDSLQDLSHIDAGLAKLSPSRIEVRSTEEEWELQLRYALPDPSESSEREAAREEINTQLLRRLCLIQFASFKSETEDGGEQLLTLKFPVRYESAE